MEYAKTAGTIVYLWCHRMHHCESKKKGIYLGPKALLEYRHSIRKSGGSVLLDLPRQWRSLGLSCNNTFRGHTHNRMREDSSHRRNLAQFGGQKCGKGLKAYMYFVRTLLNLWSLDRWTKRTHINSKPERGVSSLKLARKDIHICI